jgi:hypothetical protein
MMTLSDAELEELTQRHRVDARRRALEAMKIPYRVRHDGTLAVLRAHVERDPDAAPGATINAREPQLRL